MPRPGFSRRHHRELVERARAEGAALAAIKASNEDIEMRDVVTPPSSPGGSAADTNTLDLEDAEVELRFILQQEMARGAGTWISVSTRLQEKLRQNSMIEIIEGDVDE